MSESFNKAAIDNARALLATLLESGWSELHVVSGETKIFIARDGGRANPMREAPAASAEPAVAGAMTTVTAPHVATLVSAAAPGSSIEKGAVIATIAVLDEEEPVLAPVSGRVLAVHADPGALVEFKTPLVDLEESAA